MSDGMSPGIWQLDHGPGDVATLWFDSPGRSQNVLDLPAFEELDRILSRIEAEPSLRGLLIRSRKAAGFCAGADLKTIRTSESPAELKAYFRRGLDVIDRLGGLKIPTSAVVHGVCLGGGLELALACRTRIALASNAPLQLGCPELQHGLIPCWGALVRLPRLLAPRDALLLLLTGIPIGFLQAKSQGLVNRLVSADEPGRIAEALQREAVHERPIMGDAWAHELEFAAAKAEEQMADFPEAQQRILQLIELDLAQGPEVARAAAIDLCADLAGQPASRHAIADFFDRRQSARQQEGRPIPVMPIDQ